MPLYDVYCSRPECDYVEEKLLRGPIGKVPCPRCEEDKLVKKAVQVFSVHNGNKAKPKEKAIKVTASICSFIIGFQK